MVAWQRDAVDRGPRRPATHARQVGMSARTLTDSASAFVALQNHAGNRAVVGLLTEGAQLQRQCSGECECSGCAGEQKGDDATEPPMRLIMQRVMLQRDAAAADKVRVEVAKPDPKKTGAGYTEAFKVLNSLPMYDMLSTLTSLRRSGQFTDLSNNLEWAIGVYVDRIRVAINAVSGKGAISPDAFLDGNKILLAPLQKAASDQVKNIIDYLDPKWLDVLKQTEDASPLIKYIRAHTAYTSLAPNAKAETEAIINEAQGKPALLVYYMTKLKVLFDTPYKDPATITAETNAATTTATAAETKRLATPAGAKRSGVEENASASKKRVWTAIRGRFGGGVYYVDRSSPTNIVVQARVFLQPKGTGTPADVKKIRRMGDAIEKAASTKGYIVDVVFVDTPAPDGWGNPPFTVDVDPSSWEVATNWAGGDPKGLAHELHHMFAFELDRYDYIEAHSTNQSMAVDQRLIWFHKEMSKPDGFNDKTSIMNNADHPNDDDVCRVAGLDPVSCVNLRKKSPKP